MRGKRKERKEKKAYGRVIFTSMSFIFDNLTKPLIYAICWRLFRSFFAPYNIDDVSIDNLTAFDDNAGKRKEEGRIMV